jgi:hypothetical protein
LDEFDPFDVVTITLATPDPVGVTQVIVVSFTTTTLVADTPLNFTDVAPVKLDPVIVTDVPPDVVPNGGVTDVTEGRAFDT